MYPEFNPLFQNAHLATIAGNFWRRDLDVDRFPLHPVRYQIDENTAVLSLEHQPEIPARAQLVSLHGLEGSANAGYIQSLAQAALTGGIGVHRLNLRTCGGTEDLCQTMYHSGLTQDTFVVLQRIKERFEQPLFLAGFSLGGNVALKLAGEYDCSQLLSGVCSVSAPIDLAACVRAIDRPANVLYARRFLDRLKRRVSRKSRLHPDLYRADQLSEVSSIWSFDDRFTAPLFGFGTAANYYATQSAKNFLAGIEVDGLLITAQDDPLVPFSIYQENPSLRSNPNLHLVAPEKGGHVGFLSRRRPRFWVDSVILNWIENAIGESVLGTAGRDFSSV